MDHGIQLAASNRNLSYQLAKKLGKDILTGEYDQEGILPGELSLCQKHKLSRTAVREAIKILAAKGMVLSRPKIGTRVLPQKYWNFLDYDLLLWVGEKKNPQLVNEFMDLRRQIEPEVAYQFSQHCDKYRQRQLGFIIDRMFTSQENKDNDQWYQDQIEFYQYLYLESGNRFVIPIGNLLPLLLPRTRLTMQDNRPILFQQFVKAIVNKEQDQIYYCCLALLK